MTKKKKTFLIFGAILLALLVILVTLVLIFHKGYLQKTDYDHVSDVAYNDVRIVGRNGLFYLMKNGKTIGDGYVSLQSVNDAYAEISPDWQNADDLTFYDFYIARRTGKSEYFLLSSDGEEYMITGDNLSLSAIRLPFLIFIDNTTGQHAAMSLDLLDSDLSASTGTQLSLKPFSSVTPTRINPNNLLFTHLETYEAASDTPYSVYSHVGAHLFSSELFEKNAFAWDETQYGVYYRDTHKGTVYDATGTVLGIATSPISQVSDTFAWLRCTAPTGEGHFLLVLSAKKSFLLSEQEYNLSSPACLDGSILLPTANGNAYALIAALDGTVTPCLDAEALSAGVVLATASDNGDRLVFSKNATQLMRTAYTDITLIPSLSDGECFAFESAQCNEERVGHYLHFVREGNQAVTVGLAQDTHIASLTAQGDRPVSGSFLLTEQDAEGNPQYRLLCPFTTRMFSDTFDCLDVYCQADIVWARGASYSRLTYAFLDPISAQTVTTIACTKEEMALVQFEFSKSDSLLSDPYDAESAVPILMLSLTYGNEQDVASTHTVRHFALYRCAAATSKSFDTAALCVTEIGKGLLRSNPIEIFPEDNVIVCHDADSSRVYRLNETNVLTETASAAYHISGVLRDSSSPTTVYYLVESDTAKKGLYDANGSPILSPYYDEILSADTGHFVVSLRGAFGVVEYTAGAVRQILDYLYTDIVPLADHAYLVTNGAREVFLFEGKNKLSDQAVQSCESLYSYYINEDGQLCYRLSLLFSIDGQLSLHNCGTEFRPIAVEFERATVDNKNIANQRALAIYYYHEGKRIAVDVILPTESSRAAFSLPEAPNGSSWYWEAHAGNDATPVTKEDILALTSHTVILYSAS